MRPAQLRVEGFTCFKKEQVVDFDGLDLFAISGPTGAGKSSLLDTMVYALYGRVPRVGKRGYTEFISLGANRMSVRFDFRLGDQLYRVTRTARRQGAPSAQIEQLAENGDTLRALADGIAAVDKFVQQTIGLDYDGFIQAVVLPQGEFARFLKSAPGDRTTLLRDLLRLGRYEEMRKHAQVRSSAAQTDAGHLEKRLAEDYGGATAPEVASLEEKVAHEKKEMVRLRKLLDAAEIEAKNARRLRERTAELEAKRVEREELALRKREVAGKERRLEASRRAAKVAPILDQLRQAEERAEKAAEELGTGDSAVRRAVEMERKALASAERADKAARQIPELDKQIQKVAEIIGLLEPKSRLEESVRGFEKDNRALQERLDQLGHQRAKEAKRLESAEKELGAAQRELKGIGYDSKLYEKVDAVLEDAAAAQKLRQSLEELREVAQEASAEVTSAKKTAQAAASRVEASADTLEKAVRTANKAEATLREAERVHAAHHLKSELRTGKPCPVCEQPVRVLPKARRVVTRLEELRSEAEAARTRATGAQQRHAELEADAKSSARAEVAAGRKVKSAAEAVTAKGDEYAEATRRLVAWGRKAHVELTEPAEAQVIRLDRELRAKRKRHDEATEAVREAAKTKDDGQRALEKLDAHAVTTQEKLARNAEQLAEVREHLGEYEKKMRAVVGEADPREVRDALQEERAQLDEAQNQTRRAAHDASKGVAQARALLAAAKDQQDKNNRELQGAQAKAQDGLATAGFEREASARAALLDDKTVRQLDREIREYEQKTAAIDARLGELEKELGGQHMSQQELKRREKERDDLAAGVERTVGVLRVAEEQLERLRERLTKAQELRSQLEAHREIVRIYGALADELQSNRFQQYLLEDTVRDVVAGASERLKKISDRYALALQEGEFFVVDQDNAGEQRSADTLSGGETFLTSLALALELSAQVQHAAGALQLESIFIDEGFGTLDPDTLETVTAAIEALPMGGRMVGIITHIPELTERLPGRVAIEKGPDGSRVHVSR